MTGWGRPTAVRAGSLRVAADGSCLAAIGVGSCVPWLVELRERDGADVLL
jgi:hypothetical protein